MIDARHLGPGGICGEARHLLAEHLAWTVEDLRRDAFVSAVELRGARFEAEATAKEMHAAAMGALSLADRLGVDEAFADYLEDVRRGDIPVNHAFNRPLALDLSGRALAPAAYTPATILGNADCAWCASPGDEASGAVAVVLNHFLDRGQPLPPPAEDLHLGFLGVAWAQVNELDRARVGRCFHKGASAPRYEWSPVLEEDQLGAIWHRIKKAAVAPRKAVIGAHCELCPVRRFCAEWLLPAMPAAEALAPFQRKGGPPLTKERAGRALRTLRAMQDAAAAVEAQLRTYARNEGGIPDGRGNVWGPVQPRGKQTAEVFEWRAMSK